MSDGFHSNVVQRLVVGWIGEIITVEISWHSARIIFTYVQEEDEEGAGFFGRFDQTNNLLILVRKTKPVVKPKVEFVDERRRMFYRERKEST